MSEVLYQPSINRKGVPQYNKPRLAAVSAHVVRLHILRCTSKAFRIPYIGRSGLLVCDRCCTAALVIYFRLFLVLQIPGVVAKPI